MPAERIRPNPAATGTTVVTKQFIYLFGIAGHAELSPAMRAVEAGRVAESLSRRFPASMACPASSHATSTSIGSPRSGTRSTQRARCPAR